jgi:hypothetical protein
MPIAAMLLVAAVVSVFAAFAAVLIWNDFRTRPVPRLQPRYGSRGANRRRF